MEGNNVNYPVRELEEDYLSYIRNDSLTELSEKFGVQLDSLTDLIDLAINLYKTGIRSLLQKEKFLDLPVIAHCSYGNREAFLIEAYPLDNGTGYRAISIDNENHTCDLSFHSRIPEYEVKDSKYKTVRDILPLMDEVIFDGYPLNHTF